MSSQPSPRRRLPLAAAAVLIAVVAVLGAGAGAEGPAGSGPEAGGAGSGPVVRPHEEGPLPPANPSGQTLSHLHCDRGFAGPYPCRAVDLEAFVPRAELGAGPEERLNDLWGWTDPQSGREYALVGLEGGTTFVDVTDPHEPVVLGELPTRSVSSTWRSIKTYRNHALVVADRAGAHGLQVFDLTQLRRVSRPPVTFQATAEYHGDLLGGNALGSAHNVVVDEESGFAYAVGSDSCAGGLHMIDVRDPARPAFAGCFAADGYTHDAQCVVYRGPDARLAGRQLCFAANEDTLTIVDVTDKAAPALLSRTGYPGVQYTHQVWLTEDQRYLLLDDELDEMRNGHGSRTYIWDASDLLRPRVIGTYTAASPATDHNLYIRGRWAFLANYRSGLRILDLAAIAQGRLREAAFFDVDPASDAAGFAGSWSPFPFFASGTVLVNSIGDGLFVLHPRLEGPGSQPPRPDPADRPTAGEGGRPNPGRPPLSGRYG